MRKSADVNISAISTLRLATHCLELVVFLIIVATTAGRNTCLLESFLARVVDGLRSGSSRWAIANTVRGDVGRVDFICLDVLVLGGVRVSARQWALLDDEDIWGTHKIVVSVFVFLLVLIRIVVIVFVVIVIVLDVFCFVAGALREKYVSLTDSRHDTHLLQPFLCPLKRTT